ncbi:hypothetical protein J437_LFUL004961 [Ladona fulva]|uniref:Uncharacterized protein n=1 Tax=Ladona fulva TaxID=123851 RepID=A0A8K0JW54_LADFU|nr:hypothetical protein J437_LFUL004961 [Ladona fulva]
MGGNGGSGGKGGGGIRGGIRTPPETRGGEELGSKKRESTELFEARPMCRGEADNSPLLSITPENGIRGLLYNEVEERALKV